MRIHYPFHPMHGKEIIVHGTIKNFNEHYYITNKTDGRKTYIPSWMADPITKNIKIKDNPAISINCLRQLYDLLYTFKLNLHNMTNQSLNGVNNEKKQSKSAGIIPGIQKNEIKSSQKVSGSNN